MADARTVAALERCAQKIVTSSGFLGFTGGVTGRPVELAGRCACEGGDDALVVEARLAVADEHPDRVGDAAPLVADLAHLFPSAVTDVRGSAGRRAGSATSTRL